MYHNFSISNLNKFVTMKKINLYLIIIVMFAIIVNSCTPNIEENNDQNSIKLTGSNFYTVGIWDYFLPNIQLFYLSSNSGNLNFSDETNKITGSGYGFDITFLSYVNEQGCPITKQEIIPNISFEEAFEDPSLMEPGKCVIDLVRIENGEVEKINVENITLSFEPNSTFKEMEYRIETTINGENTTFIFKGKPEITDVSFTKLQHEGIEPKAINKNIIFVENEITYDCATSFCQNTLNTIEIDIESEEYLAYFICYGSPKNKKDIYGTYTFSKEHNVGTASQSPGGSIEYEDGEKFYEIFPSAIARFNSTTYEEEFFIIKDGSITIEENKIYFNVTTYGGSNISGSYEGKLDIQSEQERYGSDFTPKKQRLLFLFSNPNKSYR